MISVGRISWVRPTFFFIQSESPAISRRASVSERKDVLPRLFKLSIAFAGVLAARGGKYVYAVSTSHNERTPHENNMYEFPRHELLLSVPERINESPEADASDDVCGDDREHLP